MIERVSVKHLKSLLELEFSCEKLNLITGTNSSGKSTLIQSILLAKQNIDSEVGLNGALVNFGSFTDAKNFNAPDKSIHVSMDFDADASYTLIIDEHGVRENFLNPTDTSFHLDYLSCDRIGAEDVYRKNYISNTDVGINGEFAIYSLDENKDKSLPEELRADHSSFTLIAQVNYWLDYILGATITTEDVVGTDIVKCFYSTSNGRLVRPKNMGAGFSYLISILIMCLLSEENDVIIIENPEIHLHPQAQSKVCEFLYFIAKNNRQLFIETHSDHIFNGVRAGITTGDMNPNDITVNFFTMDDRDCTRNTVIEFGKRGRILNYRAGLFDQFDADLDKMLNI